MNGPGDLNSCCKLATVSVPALLTVLGYCGVVTLPCWLVLCLILRVQLAPAVPCYCLCSISEPKRCYKCFGQEKKLFMWGGDGLISLVLGEGEKSTSTYVLLVLTCLLPAVITHGICA